MVADLDLDDVGSDVVEQGWQETMQFPVHAGLRQQIAAVDFQGTAVIVQTDSGHGRDQAIGGAGK